MPRYAIVNGGGLVENVIVAAAVPSLPNRVAVLVAPGQAVAPGDSYDGTVFTPYQPTAAELERRNAPALLRAALARMTQIAQQADTISQATGALTLAQVTTQLRQLAGAVADMSRAIRYLIWQAGQDDGA